MRPDPVPPPPSPAARRGAGLAALWLAATSLALAAPGPVSGQAAPASTQQVRGLVLDGATDAPIEGAMVLLLDGGDEVRGRTLTGPSGAYRLAVPAAGRWRLRVDRIGYASTASDPFEVAAGAALQRTLRTAVRPVELAGLDVEGERRCEVRPAEGAATARVWEEARKALAAATWTAEREMYRFAWTRFTRRIDESGRRVLDETRTNSRRFVPQPFTAQDPAKLADEGYVVTLPDGTWSYMAPDASVLLSDPFLDTHCFRLRAEERDGVRLVGLAFEPVDGRRLPDVEGVLWLEAEGARLRSLEYEYVNLHRELPEHGGGGELTFTGLPNGTWIVQEWRIRMPRIAVERDNEGRTRRLTVTGYEDEGGIVQRAATVSGEVVMDNLGGTIDGTVSDSLGRPAAGARVWVQGTAYGAVADAAGAFSIPSLAPGLWTVRASGSALDAVGYEGSAVDVELAQAEARTVRLELPSVHRVALERCRSTPPGNDEAVVIGRVVGADGAPVPDAGVRVQWTAYERTVAGGGGARPAPGGGTGDAGGTAFQGRDLGVAGTADRDGLFWFCAVPSDFTVRLSAEKGGVVSEAVELWIDRSTEVASARLVIPGVR